MPMKKLILPIALLVLSGAALAAEGSKPPVPFTDAFLADEHNIHEGREIWEEQCQHCHGKKAYPGKAPKLQPRRYKPDFVYRRVTDGFRKMPPWKDVYSDEERMQVTAYVLSSKFSP
jgi:mono/diheme cytochrome c family protein